VSLKLTSARVVGTGSIGSRYLRVLTPFLHNPPIAVSVRGSIVDPDLAASVVLEAPHTERVDYVDLTVIATRTGRHVTDALQYQDSTRLLLIEKPIGARLADAVGRGLRTDPGVQVASPLRFTDGFDYLRRQLPFIGEVTGAHCECRSWLPGWRPGTDYRASYSADPEEGGVLRDLIHEVDYVLDLFGTPERLSAQMRGHDVLPIGGEAVADLLWGYSGFSLSMNLDYLSRPPARGIRVFGTQKSLFWDVLGATVDVYDHERGSAHRHEFPQDRDRDRLLLLQLSDLVGGRFPSRGATVGDGLRAIAICDVARESSAAAGVALLLDSAGTELT